MTACLIRGTFGLAVCMVLGYASLPFKRIHLGWSVLFRAPFPLLYRQHIQGMMCRLREKASGFGLVSRDCRLMKGKDDEALFERLVDGDQECLRPLMERYGDALTLYVNGYVHDVDAAEDMMIEAFSRMLVKRPQLSEGGFRLYLYKIARNLALRHVRLRARFMNIDDLDEEPESGERVEDGILHDERARTLYRCLDKIPADYREALYLVYIDNMSYDDAGAIMRKSRKQVDNLVQRGKAAMRKQLGEEGVSYEID